MSTGHWIAGLEMFLAFGLVIAWCLWELFTLRRDRLRDDEKMAPDTHSGTDSRAHTHTEIHAERERAAE